MQTYIQEFCTENDLDDSKQQELIDMVNKCFTCYITHMSEEWLTAAPKKASSSGTTGTKKEKVEKIESAADAVSLEQLNSPACTAKILSDYCREHKLRIGGKKEDQAARVWRHLSGTPDEDDTSPKGKGKKGSVSVAAAKKEKHNCFACNSKGQPCGLDGSEQFDDEWFCFRHIEKAAEIIASKKDPAPASPPKKAVSKRPSAAIKKAVVTEEVEDEE